MNRHLTDTSKWKYLAGLSENKDYIKEDIEPGVGDNIDFEKTAVENLKIILDQVLADLDISLLKLKNKKITKLVEQEDPFDYDQDEDFVDLDLDEDFVDLDLDDNFDYKYNTFEEFVESKYGSDLSDKEKIKAVSEWATGYNVGENPGDFIGLAEYVTPEILDILKTSDISKIFLDELESEIKYLSLDSPQDLNEVIDALAGLKINATTLNSISDKISKWSKKRKNNDWIKKSSDWISKEVDKNKNSYLSKIKTLLKKFFPNSEDQKINKASIILLISITSILQIILGNEIEDKNFEEEDVQKNISLIDTKSIGKKSLDSIPLVLTSLGIFTYGS